MDALAKTSTMMGQPDLWGAGFKTLGMLCIVVSILILVLFLMKRLFYERQASNNRQLIRVLASYHVSPKQRIVVIDVAGEKIVVGVTAQNLTCLAKLEKAEAIERVEGAKASGKMDVPFTKLLTSLLVKRAKDRAKDSKGVSDACPG
ncbi:MAG: flagellar biosynthetic protein FliO [Deltaproteobacteria bacterium]|nr:flagellar biosynthetic protein FliO [Deltaproteobacteria bacterium]